jgi:hypothetical protein
MRNTRLGSYRSLPKDHGAREKKPHTGRIEPYGINLPARATLASSQ